MKTKNVLFSILGIMLTIGLVSAGVIYYNSTIDVEANISEPFVTSEIPLSFSGYATDTITQEITITNNAQGTLPATISWNPNEGVVVDTMTVNGQNLIGVNQTVDIPPGETIITINFSSNVPVNTGELHLVQKNLTTWKPIVDGKFADISYSMKGDNFIVTGIPSEYTLIYYPEANTFGESVAGIIVLEKGSNDISSLPIGVDENDDYCNIGESVIDGGFNPDATQCKGAKLWLIPETGDAKAYISNWNTNAPNILFETDLITYDKETSNSIGTISVQRLPVGA